jgi:enoyl-CoA hydratase/carnithine racemase
LIEIDRDRRVLRITMNRPEKRNALNMELCRSLVDALENADRDAAAGAILLTGNGKAFCGGMDLHEAIADAQPELVQIHERLFTIIARIRKPVVAVAHGAALAGGLGLVANSHIAIAPPDARFGLTEVRIGLWPVLVFRAVAMAVGERSATELSLTGRIFEANEALRMGLVTEVSADPLARAGEIARTLSESSPAALREGLDYVNRIRGMDWAEAGRLGQETRDRLMAEADFAEGVHAFFEKRAPRWPSLGTLK